LYDAKYCSKDSQNVHCYANRVNLVLVDMCVAVQSAGDLIGLLQAIHNFVCESTVCHDKFVEIQKQRNERVGELPLQSDTLGMQTESNYSFQNPIQLCNAYVRVLF